MTTNEIIELAIQGHASTRDAIKWAIEQERDQCALIAAYILKMPQNDVSTLIRARSKPCG